MQNQQRDKELMIITQTNIIPHRIFMELIRNILLSVELA